VVQQVKRYDCINDTQKQDGDYGQKKHRAVLVNEKNVVSIFLTPDIYSCAIPHNRSHIDTGLFSPIRS
jgi:hypothetical protein